MALFSSHNMYALNTARWCGFTYYGPRQQRKVIDYIRGPASLVDKLEFVGTVGRLGARHQLINTLSRRDHVPLGMILPAACCPPRQGAYTHMA